MSDRGTNIACVSTSYTGAQVKTTEGLPCGEPPPYSACVLYPPTANSSYPPTHVSLPVNPSAYPPNGSHHQGYVTGSVQHGTASSAPFPDVTRGSENCSNAYVPRPNPYNPQPSYNPSYIPQRQNYPAANAYGRKTVILQRTDAENIARRRKKIIAGFIILLISSVVPIAIISVFFANRIVFEENKNLMMDRHYNINK